MTPADRAVAAFAARFPGQPSATVRSPGRVNLIGDHTDYNQGFVLPLAIDRTVRIALRPRDDDTVRVWSDHADEWAEFSLHSLARGGGWSAYLQGVADELLKLGLRPAGWEGVIVSDIPPGAGLSSSAAIELGTAMAFAVVSGFEWEPVEMALLCQRAENDWVGVNCGIMDQLICATGEVDRALLIDCRDLTRSPAPIPPEVAIVVLDTGTRRNLVGSVYNERRESCEAAAKALGVPALRDLDIETLESRRDRLDPVVYRRARHVINENQRTLRMTEYLEGGELVGAGHLMQQSHVSLRDDFEVSSEALNAMTVAALRSPGCYGARMTGGGFGGSCVALVGAEAVAAFQTEALERYHAAVGLRGTIIPIRASSGVSFELLD